ncbi:MAG: hypothetical protein SynsKO_44020 [Synoicihabitans sp.]
MKALLELLDETRYLGLIGISFGISALVSGGASVTLGGIWFTWRLWDDLGFPTMLIFRTLAHIFFWPGLLFSHEGKIPNMVFVAVVSFFGWFIFLAIVLMLGRRFRVAKGKAWPT